MLCNQNKPLALTALVYFQLKKRMKCHMSLEHELQENKVLKIEVAVPSIKERDNTIPESTICPYCSDVFLTNKIMKWHMSLVHELQPMKKESKIHGCPTCKKSFTLKGFLFNHMKAVHDVEIPDAFKIKQFDCTVCIKSFTSERSFKYHNKLLHDKKQILKCDTCEKQFSNMLKFKLHKRVHIRNHFCDTCGSGWTNRAELNRHHLMVHASEEERNMARIYVCKNCPLRFYTQKRLDDHEFVHLETKRYQCNQCEFRVKTDTGLRKHINGRHLGKRVSEEKRALYNARKRNKKQEKNKRNGGLYRTGEERVKYNEYMKGFAHRKRFQCLYCEKKTINLDFHTKMHHQDINPPMFISRLKTK